MNQAIEDYFIALLTAATLPHSPGLFPGTSAEIRVPEDHAVLVISDTVETLVAQLKKTMVRVAVSSPTDNREEHSAIAAAVRDAMEGTLPAGTSYGFNVGGFRTKTESSVPTDDGRWVTSIEGVFGLERIVV